VIAFKWYAPNHYVPSWEEVVVSLAVVSAELWVFRWVVNRMPVLATAQETRPGQGAQGAIRLVA
jgi:Ni/Fe-hydrogenase subunit HybB-like protein